MKTLRIKKWTRNLRPNEAPWKVYRSTNRYGDNGEQEWDHVRDVAFHSEHDALAWVRNYYETQRRAEHVMEWST